MEINATGLRDLFWAILVFLLLLMFSVLLYDPNTPNRPRNVLPIVAESKIAPIELVEPERPNWTLQDQREIFCLTQNMYHEARSQNFAGQLAVSMVVMNRVNADRFPDTICDVVYQARLSSTGAPLRHKCAFSWWCDGLSDSMHNRRSYEDLHELAETIYKRRNVLMDLTYGATHYHANYVAPWWTRDMEVTAVVDDHIFYNYRKKR